MYKIGEYIVYKKNVCKIIEKKSVRGNDYYVLEDIDDETLKISIPTTSNSIRKIISFAEGESLINSIPKIDIINVPDKELESEYKKLLNSGDLSDLVKIIKTTYLRNKKRIEDHKKIGEKDENYFNKAEKLLYNELSVAFDMSYDDTKCYIKEKVENLVK